MVLRPDIELPIFLRVFLFEFERREFEPKYKQWCRTPESFVKQMRK